ncbi:MAG: sterol desaturase family protein [Chloroherpetonaceae bacterium]|nr:sterol desaturase family protein [Chloroherpetonaceae bacterium]MDW8436630.1 sterol desaturase family protein [Chloroherpetonaceae bacterium]
MKLFVSRAKETPRMFRSDFAEFFSRVHWTVPLWLYVPFIAYLLWESFVVHRVGALAVAGLFALGVFLWTLAEYLLHQFVFHYHPKSEWGKRVIWIFHGVHHDYPSDPLRLVMPPVVSLPLAALFYGAFMFILGERLAPSLMAGFTLGYLIYDISHYAIHHFNLKGAYFGWIREHHMRHHFSEPNRGFGVSSPLWDIAFGTDFQRPKAKSESLS